jgi:F420-dependent oxidoreductase-like protein
MASHSIRFGIQTGQQNIAWDDMLALWQKADAWGYDSLWNFDHFFPIFTDPSGPCFEGWTTLAALAQATKRARVGSLVNGNTYRNPALTAKMAATLDHVSHGRFNLGIGAGWFEGEHTALGFDFKNVPKRLQALDEACQIIRGMFTQETTSLDGRHYKVVDAFGAPKPVQKPHPPIMIGGTGKKILLRIVAEHADMWNTSGPAELMAQKIDVIRRHGDTVRRDTTAIEMTVMMPLCYRNKEREDFVQGLIAGMRGTTAEEARKQIMIGEKQECLDTVARYKEVGVTHFIFMLFTPYFVDEIQAFAEEVIPAARRI